MLRSLAPLRSQREAPTAGLFPSWRGSEGGRPGEQLDFHRHRQLWGRTIGNTAGVRELAHTCQAIYKGVQGAEWGNLYYKCVKMNKEVNVRNPSGSGRLCGQLFLQSHLFPIGKVMIPIFANTIELHQIISVSSSEYVRGRLKQMQTFVRVASQHSCSLLGCLRSTVARTTFSSKFLRAQIGSWGVCGIFLTACGRDILCFVALLCGRWLVISHRSANHRRPVRVCRRLLSAVCDLCVLACPLSTCARVPCVHHDASCHFGPGIFISMMCLSVCAPTCHYARSQLPRRRLKPCARSPKSCSAPTGISN